MNATILYIPGITLSSLKHSVESVAKITSQRHKLLPTKAIAEAGKDMCFCKVAQW